MLTIIHGSHRHGYSWDITTALKEQLESHQIEFSVIDVSNIDLNYCCGDQVCQDGECIYQKDDFCLVKDNILDAQGIYIITPTYFNMPPAKLKCLIDRTNALLPVLEKRDTEAFFGAYVCGEADNESISCNLNLLKDYASVMGWRHIEKLDKVELISESPKVDADAISKIISAMIEELQPKGE